MPVVLVTLVTVSESVETAHAQQSRIMTATDLSSLTNPDGYERISYGTDPVQFGDLRLPDGEGPHPVAIILHGGCYLSRYSLDYMGEFARATTEQGFATWNLEYRRVGDEGGGWPGTFTDVAAGADHLRALAEERPLDLSRVLVIGHSSGGQLAIWLAGRASTPSSSDLFSEDPLPVHRVLSLAPVTDIARRYHLGNCDHSAAKLMGGGPDEKAKRYREVSPIETLPVPVPHVLLLGDQEEAWRQEDTAVYLERARASDGKVHFQPISGSGHFEVIDPRTEAWNQVRRALLELRRELE